VGIVRSPTKAAEFDFVCLFFKHRGWSQNSNAWNSIVFIYTTVMIKIKFALDGRTQKTCKGVLLVVASRNLLSKPNSVNYRGFPGRQETPWHRIRTDKRSKVIYPCNRPCRPIGLWYFEDPTFSRQSAHRLRWDFQPYAPAALNAQKDSWYSFLLYAESTLGP
jgi:hypothetical protein